ncbi:integrase core domain-containing protein [Salmonella enterica subsp. enterica]|nr:integrase core domain-containing protein [Salmonella enterica subsp. enterica]
MEFIWRRASTATLYCFKPNIPYRNTLISSARKRAQEITERWVSEYNRERPHESLS